MKNNIVVLDTNVFLEVIFNRKLKNNAIGLLKKAAVGEVKIIEPPILLDEIAKVIAVNSDDLVKIERQLRILDKMVRNETLQIVVPNVPTVIKAIEIFKSGHPKSGYPEYSDSLFHSLAIQFNGVFITNDKVHYSKTSHLKHIALLEDYH